MSPNPLEIAHADIDDARAELLVRWGDEHASPYPLRYLRAQCPCAACRTEREAASGNPLHVVAPDPRAYRIVDIEPTGRYGMRLTWGDGHATGIYTFEYLRSICPCESCRTTPHEPDAPFAHGIYIPGKESP